MLCKQNIHFYHILYKDKTSYLPNRVSNMMQNN